ncbi:hypothetical protein ACQ4PT_017196 [Festuca glaucescens]
MIYFPRTTSPPRSPKTPDLYEPPIPSPQQFVEMQFAGANNRGLSERANQPDRSAERQPTSPIRPEGSTQEPHNPLILQVPEVPHLELDLQAMSISDQQQMHDQEAPGEQYAIYMKLAATRSTPRSISLTTMQTQMKRAWRVHYGDIVQVHDFVFKASFTSFLSMMWVYEKQPWRIGPDIILLELADPEGEGYQLEQAKSVEAQGAPKYSFNFVYVSVRVYGIPKERRSLKLLSEVMSMIGTPSELHQLRTNMITTHPDYIWGVVRHTICTPVLDRIKLVLSPQVQCIAYLHYEKIGRICLFYGVMFHTIDQCYLRKSIVSERIRHSHNPMQVPFQRYGAWIIDESKIPMDRAVANTPVFSTFQNPELSSFNNVFATPERRRGRLSERAVAQIIGRMEAARTRATASMATQRNEEEGTVVVTPNPTDVVLSEAQDMQGTHVEQQN